MCPAVRTQWAAPYQHDQGLYLEVFEKHRPRTSSTFLIHVHDLPWSQ